MKMIVRHHNITQAALSLSYTFRYIWNPTSSFNICKFSQTSQPPYHAAPCDIPTILGKWAFFSFTKFLNFHNFVLCQSIFLYFSFVSASRSLPLSLAAPAVPSASLVSVYTFSFTTRLFMLILLSSVFHIYMNIFWLQEDGGVRDVRSLYSVRHSQCIQIWQNEETNSFLSLSVCKFSRFAIYCVHCFFISPFALCECIHVLL